MCVPLSPTSPPDPVPRIFSTEPFSRILPRPTDETSPELTFPPLTPPFSVGAHLTCRYGTWSVSEICLSPEMLWGHEGDGENGGGDRCVQTGSGGETCETP